MNNPIFPHGIPSTETVPGELYYTAEQLCAAIEADRAQRGPDVEAIITNLIFNTKLPNYYVKQVSEVLRSMLAASPQPHPVQPISCEWTYCPRRVGDVCCNEQAKPEQAAQPMTDEETALNLLAEVFDAYENGTPCYEEPDEHGSFVGNAFVLSNETFHACADLLNRRRPVSAAPQPKD